MNKKILKTILKNTDSYEKGLLEDLKDPRESKAYLEAAFESYKEDSDAGVLLLAMRDVAEAQGGLGALAKRISVTRQHLYQILSNKHKPRLDNWLEILSGLGFRVKLERQKLRPA